MDNDSLEPKAILTADQEQSPGIDLSGSSKLPERSMQSQDKPKLWLHVVQSDLSIASSGFRMFIRGLAHPSRKCWGKPA